MEKGRPERAARALPKKGGEDEAETEEGWEEPEPEPGPEPEPEPEPEPGKEGRGLRDGDGIGNQKYLISSEEKDYTLCSR